MLSAPVGVIISNASRYGVSSRTTAAPSDSRDMAWQCQPMAYSLYRRGGTYGLREQWLFSCVPMKRNVYCSSTIERFHESGDRCDIWIIIVIRSRCRDTRCMFRPHTHHDWRAHIADRADGLRNLSLYPLTRPNSMHKLTEPYSPARWVLADGSLFPPVSGTSEEVEIPAYPALVCCLAACDGVGLGVGGNRGLAPYSFVQDGEGYGGTETAGCCESCEEDG
jgi:hypothetical protein